MIGFFDSGSGGLTVLSAARAAFPRADMIYFGDHAKAPYGHRSSAEIVENTKAGVDHLFREGADLVILACNTAAAIALRHLQQTWLPQAWPGKRLLGVLVPMVEAVTGVPWQYETSTQSSDTHHVMLFATRRTITSKAYRDEVAKRAPNMRLTEVACPGLVDAIEGGAPRGALDGLIGGYVADAVARHGQPKQVILGCTHFPLVADLFSARLGGGVAVFDQPDIVTRSLGDYLARHGLKLGEGGASLLLQSSADDVLSADDLGVPGVAGGGWARVSPAHL